MDNEHIMTSRLKYRALILTVSASALLLVGGCAAPVASNSGMQPSASTELVSVQSTVKPSGAEQKPNEQIRTTEAPPTFVITTNGVTTFSGVGAKVEAATPGAVSSVSEASAIAILSKSNLVTQLAGSVTPNLRLVEYQNVFGAVGEDGSMASSVPRQLAWFATYNNVSNPGPNSKPAGSTISFGAPTNCTVYVAISATSGALIDSFDYCGTS